MFTRKFSVLFKMAPDPDPRLKILIAKKDMLYARIKKMYDLSKNISNYELRSNEQFMAETETVEDFRVTFESLIDEINTIQLTLDPAKGPSYEELLKFDDFYLRVLRARNNILATRSATVPATKSSSTPFVIKLPAIELPSFDGKTENWPIFFESFRSNIHENPQLSDSQRVQYLVGKLTHNAQRVLAGIVPTGDTYKVIWDSLVAKYQDKRALGTHYLNNIMDLKTCQGTASSLNAFIEKYSASIAALKQLDIKDLSDFILLHCAVRKMDMQTLQAFELSVSDKPIPSYKELIAFVQNQVKILERSNANNSSSASARATTARPSQNNNNGKPAAAASIRAHAFVATGESSAIDNRSCALCNKNDHVELGVCPHFLKMKSPKVRFDFIKSKQGCVNCLCLGHTVSRCSASGHCDKCDKWHHVLLHFDNDAPKNKKSNTRPSKSLQTSSSHVCTDNCVLESVPIPNDAKIADSRVSRRAASSALPVPAHPAPTPLAPSHPAPSHPASAHSATAPASSRELPAAQCSSRRTYPEDNVLTSTIGILSPREPSLSMSATTNVDAILLATAQVYAKPTNGTGKIIVRCLIDNCSQNHLITTECCKRLNLNINPLNKAELKGAGLSTRPIHGYVTLDIESRYNPRNKYTLLALVVDCITDQLPSQFIENCDMSHLQNLEMADLTWNIPGDIDIVIGCQLFSKIYMGQAIESGSRAPPALLTSLGYVLMGDCPTKRRSSQCSASFSALIRNDLDSTLQRFWELEEIPSKSFLSPAETECENSFVSSVKRDEDGRYSVALPFCADPDNLGNSRNAAQRRYTSLERKFKQVPDLRENYNTVIQEYIDRQYLSEVVESDIKDEGYYIPHHAVVRADKPLPRIVLDASARTHTGLSLNDVLHPGVNLQADLFLLLLDFRVFPVAMTADIKQMYLQIGVHDDHRKYLRILFRFNENEPVRTFQFDRVPFGLKCSPFLAMRTVRQLASDMRPLLADAARVAESKLYMDDLVHSVPDEDSAVRLAKDLISMFKAGRMDLVKWTSNSPIFLDELPNSHKSSIDFDDNKECSKVLGLAWDPVKDQFFLKVTNIHEQCTKRTILSVVARLFDVLGLVAPVILYAKLLIKELWLAQIDWDDTPPENVITRFRAFTQELPLLSTLQIPRHVGVTISSSVLLVGFCDASMNGFGCVIYLHSTDVTGNIIVRLLCSKSKVSPTKVTTLARLELCAALLLSRLMKVVMDTYRDRIQIAGVYAFSDSTIALSWIYSSPHRWSVFVSNRVAQCQENLDPQHFYHVSGIENPADCVSRGMLPSQMISHSLWWNGPSWLQLPHCEWPIHTFTPSGVEELPELKTTVMVAAVLTEPSVLCELSQRVSSWDKLLRITVLILRFIKKIKPENSRLDDLALAEGYIVRAVQSVHFADDIRLIKSNNLPSKKLRNLSVFLDADGTLRIGGRLSKSNLPFEAKHPALLPKRDPVVCLIIRHFHEINCHTGPGLLMSIIRQKFWILDARTVIRARLRECNDCFRVNPSHPTPKMADLPACRITEAKAFVHTGVDYAGPLRLLLTRRRGQHAQKAYICLFVCLVTKAVHIELVTELSSDCFLAAFKRFIARRGPVSCLYSDNGTNFVGARAQLDEMYDLLLSSQYNRIMEQELEKFRINWKMIPPRAPHFGAIWEANIKSLKTHLYRVIGNQLLTYEELQTVLVQIECIMNSRPLSVITSDPDPEVITPAHFLMSTPLRYLPASSLSDTCKNLVRRKLLLDSMVNSYWKKWHIEYLHTLQTRQKWQNNDHPIAVGTVVLIGQDDAPALSWPLGVITEVYPGTDGIVRVAKVKTKNSSFKRPVVKLYPLPSQ